MNILVTGGAGFIGSNIVDRLIMLGHNVIIIDNLSTGKIENINPNAKFYKKDITSPLMKEVFINENITHVIHHAAQIDVKLSVTNPVFDARNNILGTLNLLENCCKYGVEKVIYASSAAVYGEPEYLPVDEEHPVKAVSPYGISKLTAEHYLEMYKRLYSLDYTVLRYANVYGPRQDPMGEGGVVPIFVDWMLTGQRPIIHGDGEQTRDFIYVVDIVDTNLKALEAGDNHIINVSCKQNYSINYLYKTINQILGTKIKPIYREERKGDIRHSYLDNKKAKKILDWKPEFDLCSGLIQTIIYYARQQGRNEIAVSLAN